MRDMARPPITYKLSEGMLMHEIVPAFRGDLLVEKQEGKGLFEVTDPVSAKKFTLYDFELSIARMLNGKRTASQVIEAATKIGIPVTLESLEKFVRQLHAYGFLTDVAPPSERTPGTAWEPRAEWNA